MIGIDRTHSIKRNNQGKRIVVCNEHCCDLHGVSEFEYYKLKKMTGDKS